MAEFVSLIVKTVTSGVGWVFGLASKKYAQPKLEIDIAGCMREQAEYETDENDGYEKVPIYSYQIRLTNNSEHHAYHLRLVSCDPPQCACYLEYLKPVLAHSRECFGLDLEDPVTAPWESLGYDAVLGRSGMYGTGPDRPPLRELRIEYTNSRNKKFFTVFRPKEELEKRNELGNV
ncbi:hypothetical protein Q5H92_24610 [Hymenobacter sp. M29]|uniref:Uncharacterized protein n=1 Tax=Hymenobacter mellowenesis TaxID=3063995 RepID=A0ABT9AI66_9BACT|nr:hypothetical protein [Hymenobacter sp. M29]MDO7849567.1 hypothetical protein [Hymenobacter sp. M29]